MKFIKSKIPNINSILCVCLMAFAINSCTNEEETISLEEISELNTVRESFNEEFDSFAYQNSTKTTLKSDQGNKGKSFVVGEGWAKGNAIKIELLDFILYGMDVYQTQNYYVKYMDGQLNGQFEVFDYSADDELLSHVVGDILTAVFEDDCKTVRFTGIITASKNASMIGKYAIWTSVDNGVRKYDDQTTDIRYGMSVFAANYHASKGFPLKLFGPGVFQKIPGNVKIQSKKCE